MGLSGRTERKGKQQMIIEYTPQELEQLSLIGKKFTLKYQEIKQIHSRETAEDEKKLDAEIGLLLDQYNTEEKLLRDKFEKARFDTLKGDKKAILANAKEQIPLILKSEYEANALAKMTEKDAALFTNEGIGVYSKEQDKFLLFTDIAIEYIKEELKLHISALESDEAALRNLLKIIRTGAESSPYTIAGKGKPGTSITERRRKPLADIRLFGIMNDKTATQLLQDGDIFKQATNGQITLRWAVNQVDASRAPVPVYMALTYEGGDFKITKKLSAYDKRVYETVGTLFHYWRKENPQKPLYITPQEIWRTMNGKNSRDGQAKPGAAQVGKICDSLDKMRFTRFYMDISEEIDAFNLTTDDGRITDGHIDTYFLNSDKVEFTTEKGNSLQGYRINDEPVLYSYNKLKNHILYVPYEMLDTSQYTSDSENVTEFKGYLLQQIQLMKNAAEGGKRFKRSNTILLETLYKDTGIQPPEERAEGKDFKTEASRQKEIRRFRQSDRQKIEGILDAWKDKGWIKDYIILNSKNEPIKEKQRVSSYRIKL